MSLPFLPLALVEFMGALLLTVFSFFCLRLARQLRSRDPSNVVRVILLWSCYGLAVFAISLSLAHIAERLLMAVGYDWLWARLQPFSGAVETIFFVGVASITLFFERTWDVYQSLRRDRRELQAAHEQLLFMNRNLENLVAEQTRELALSERKYRRIFEASPDMIAVIARDGTIVDMNPSGLDMLGFPERRVSEVVGRFDDSFQNAEDWNDLVGQLATDGSVAAVELELKRKDGAGFSALLSAADQGPKGSGVATIHLLVKDISRHKNMEKQLQQADKLASIGQLASGIAHEINNPLSLILGYTQLLLRDEKEDSEQTEDLKIIEKHARTCKTIVRDLLSFARGAPSKKGPAHLHGCIQEILGVVQHQFELDGVSIDKDLDPAMPTMTLDEAKIKQVVMNLIVNAKQAIKDRGVIRIATRYDRDKDVGLFQVHDTGCGIPPEHLSRIFDPFFTTKGTGEGTGLGLSVSYGIVKDHGGEISVESEPGLGSTFTVVLPVVASGQGAA